jgi:hypothetical protein
MIIGDWGRRSNRNATKSHLPTIPDFFPNHTGFFSKYNTFFSKNQAITWIELDRSSMFHSSGPLRGKTHDSSMMNASGWLRIFRDYERRTGVRMQMFGDAGFALSRYLHAEGLSSSLSATQGLLYRVTYRRCRRAFKFFLGVAAHSTQ